MARVTGVGGVFLRSADPKRLTEWYRDQLGFELTDYGVSFSWKDADADGTAMTIWSAFPAETKYFGDEPRQVMINYRVDDMDGLLEKLRAAGVWIDPKVQDESYGKFAWIRDCDGNRVELWEPKG